MLLTLLFQSFLMPLCRKKALTEIYDFTMPGEVIRAFGAASLGQCAGEVLGGRRRFPFRNM